MLKKKITATRKFSFDSAHFLPYHEGKCRNMHGHRYEMLLTIGGDLIDPSSEQSDAGMIIDFGHLKKIVEAEVLSKLDHKIINEFMPNPTAEVMVGYIADMLEFPLGEYGVHILKIDLWENSESFATIELSEE